MTDYKLVPVEPTQEWVANLRKIRIDRMESVIEDVLAAAPAVQGEPVAVMYEDGSLLSKADCGDNFEICCKVQTPLYTAPQPAEQQPAPDVAGLVEALSALRGCIMETRGPDAHSAIVLADAALAAYRKGGDTP